MRGRSRRFSFAAMDVRIECMRRNDRRTFLRLRPDQQLLVQFDVLRRHLRRRKALLKPLLISLAHARNCAAPGAFYRVR